MANEYQGGHDALQRGWRPDAHQQPFGFPQESHFPGQNPFSSEQQRGSEQWFPQQERSKGSFAEKLKRRFGRKGGERPDSSGDEAKQQRASAELRRLAPETYGRVVQAGEATRQAAHDLRMDPLNTSLDFIEASRRMAEQTAQENAQRSKTRKIIARRVGKTAATIIDTITPAIAGYSPVDVLNAGSAIVGRNMYGEKLDPVDRAFHLVGALVPFAPSTPIIEGLRKVRKMAENGSAKHGDKLRSAQEGYRSYTMPQTEPYTPPAADVHLPFGPQSSGQPRESVRTVVHYGPRNP